MQNLGRFHTTSEFDRQYVLNDSIYPKLEIHDRERFLPVWQKSLMNLVYQMRVCTQPNQLFSGDYILDLRGSQPLNFVHALEINHVASAHHKRDGVLQNFEGERTEHLKISLKFSV